MSGERPRHQPPLELVQAIREALLADMTETDRRMMSGALQATAILAQREADAAARARRKRPTP